MEIAQRRRTHRQFYPELSLAVYYRTFQAQKVDGQLVDILPTCYTWRRHNVILTLWPPKYGQPRWRIKCGLGLRGHGSSVEQEASMELGLYEVVQKACTIIDDFMAHERLQYTDPNRAWRISRFLEEIIHQCQPADLATVAS